MVLDLLKESFLQTRNHTEHTSLVNQNWDRIARLLRYPNVESSANELEILQSWYDLPKHAQLANDLLTSSIQLAIEYDLGKLGTVVVAGHDSVHNIFVCSRILKDVSHTLPTYAAWELALSTVIHNSGRLLGFDDRNHQTVGAYIVAKASRMIGNNFQLAPELLLIQKRIMRNIIDHSSRCTGDPIGDFLKNADRMQQLTPLGPFRELLFDVGKDKLQLLPHIHSDYQIEVPAYDKYKQTAMPSTWQHWIEFMARNIYPGYDASLHDALPMHYRNILQENDVELQNQRVNSVAMLMILSGYNPQKSSAAQPALAQQIFAPELEEITKPLHWTKKRLSQDIFSKAAQRAKKFLLSPAAQNTRMLIESIGITRIVRLFLQATSGVISTEIEKSITKQFGNLNHQEEEQVISSLIFNFQQYEYYVIQEKSRAAEATKTNDPTILALANFSLDFFNTLCHPHSEFSALQRLIQSTEHTVYTDF